MPPSDSPERAQNGTGQTAESAPRTSSSTDTSTPAAPDWNGIAAMPEFRALLARKARFIVAGTVFFLAYYFALPVLVGWFPELMKREIGPVNLAYVFALSQFVMAWIVAGIYVKVAAAWDRSADEIIHKAEGK